MSTRLILALPVVASAASLDILTLPNWQRVPVGELGMVNAGAVVARVHGPAAGFQNPAGLARLHRPSVSGSVSALEYNRTAARTSTGDAFTDEVALKPNLVGFSSWWCDDDTPATDGHPGFSAFLASPVTWTSALEVNSQTSTGERRDSGRSSFEMLAPGVAAGLPLGEHLSAGLGLELWLISYRYDAGSSAFDNTTVLTSSVAESGQNISLRATLGLQYQAGAWQLGMVVRSPGMIVRQEGAITTSTTSGDSTTTTWTDVARHDAGFGMRLPWHLALGVAWKPPFLPGVTAEADLNCYSGVGASTIFKTSQGTTRTTTGGITTVQPYGIPERTHTADAIINPSAGLSWQLPGTLLRRTVTLHAGGFIDNSPVGDSDLFTELDLLGATGGISLAKGPMRVTLGGMYVLNANLRQALSYVGSPNSGLQPDLSDPHATYSVRTLVLTIGSTYEF